MNRFFTYVASMLSRHWWITIGIFAVASLCLGLFMGLGRSVWFDESYSVMVAQRSFQEMIELVKVDAHPPLFYVYLKVWGEIFGWSELSLRMSSAVPGALSVVFIMVIIRRLFSMKAALMTGVFVVMAPFLIRYDFEIRMYALVTLLGVVGTWVLLKARESHSRIWWLAYAIVVTLGMYTLYMSIVIWLAHAAWLLYLDVSSKRNVFRQKHWLYFGLAVALFVPWIPVVIAQLQNSALPPYMLRVTFESLSSAVTMLLLYEPIWETPPLAGLVLVIILAIAGWLLVQIRRFGGSRRWQSIMLLLFCSFTAIIFYAVLTLPPNPPRFTDRYLVHVSLYFYALLAVVAVIGYSIGKKKAALCMGALTFGVLCYGLFSLLSTGNYNFQRLQPAHAKTVQQMIDCSDATIVASNAYAYIDMWYDLSGCDLRFYQPTDYLYTGGYAPLNALSNSKRIKSPSQLNARTVAVIHFDDSEDFLRPDSRYVLDKVHEYQGMKLYVYRLSIS